MILRVEQGDVRHIVLAPAGGEREALQSRAIVAHDVARLTREAVAGDVAPEKRGVAETRSPSARRRKKLKPSRS